ncbi:MAG: 3-methyl-2-oxobutanoate hydroxymethyltransferase, partial [Candidatus Limnocylindria bacterium]
DLLGLTEGRAPRFVKRYAQLAEDIRQALTAYAADVRRGAFPAAEHSYGIPDEELALFESELDSGVLVGSEDARGSSSDWL